MDNSKNTAVNNIPKAFMLFLILLPATGIFLIEFHINNDFYFIYPMGEYIINNGFPLKDILTFHTDMNIIIQQWLTDIILYYVYLFFGKAGIMTFAYIFYIIIASISYKLCKLISENSFVSAVCALISDIIVALNYVHSRPQVISYTVFILEVYILEKYVKTKNAKLLILIPLLSLALINIHASMWLLFFVFAMPYVAAAIPFKFKKIEQKPCCSFWALLITGVISFAVGFINPYGIKAMTYGVVSFGNSELHALVSEMETTTLKSSLGIIFYSLLAAAVLIMIFKKNKRFSLRFFLLFAGTAFIAVTNTKSVAFFIILGIPAFSYFIGDVQPKIPSDEGKKNQDKKAAALLGVFFVLISFAAAVSNSTLPVSGLLFKDETQYASMDEIVEELDKTDPDKILLFTNIDAGPYFEFKGYHPYIDCRMELFLKEINGSYDYFGEYIDVCTGKTYYKDFLDKYGFTHLVLTVNEGALLEGVKNDSDYILVKDIVINNSEYGEKYLFVHK